MNPDIMPHNLVIVAPGSWKPSVTLQKPWRHARTGSESFVPATPDVRVHKLIVKCARADHHAPVAAGSYPCMHLPGHWVMNGVMEVTP